VPPTASIVFSAQTADSPLDGGAPDFSTAQVVLLATSTASTTPPGDLVYIDTGVDAGTTGRFNLAMPPVVSKNNLRLTVTLNPTADGLAAPTLIDWQVWVDCVAAE
jgi:hypothetical protein